MYEVKCMFVCYRYTSLPCGLPPHMIHVLNQHDARSELVHNSFAFTVHCVPKELCHLFFAAIIWFLLSDFNDSFNIRNDQGMSLE